MIVTSNDDVTAAKSCGHCLWLYLHFYKLCILAEVITPLQSGHVNSVYGLISTSINPIIIKLHIKGDQLALISPCRYDDATTIRSHD